MNRSKFWRISSRQVHFFCGLPTDVQALGSMHLRAGDGIIIGDLDSDSSVVRVNFIAVVERVLADIKVFQANWRSVDLILEPSAQGSRYWKSNTSFNFDHSVVVRYELDSVFSNIYGSTHWTKARREFSSEIF